MSSSEVFEEIREGPTVDYIAPRAPLTILCDCKKSDDRPISRWAMINWRFRLGANQKAAARGKWRIRCEGGVELVTDLQPVAWQTGPYFAECRLKRNGPRICNRISRGLR